MKIQNIVLISLFCAVGGFLYYLSQNKQPRDTSILVVGTSLDYPPYEFIDKITGQPAGFDIDAVRALAEKLGKTLVLKNMPFSSLIFSLLTNDIDMIAAGMSPTERRARLVSFTDPYLIGHGFVILSKAGKFEPNSVQDLQGKAVAVNTGHTADLYMSKISGVNLVKLDSPADCFLALQAGSVDAFVCGHSTVQAFLAQHADPQRFWVKEIAGAQEVDAFVVNKNNEKLLQQINQALRVMTADKTLETIKQRWGF
jgi:ABC-type amino acid transport substrate-binding protein